MNIYESLIAVNRGVTAISKAQKNQQQGFMYRGIDDIFNDLHSVLAENGVIILPEVSSYEVSEKISKNGGILFYTRANITYHFVAEDSSSVEVRVVGEAMDSGDKGMNKAMSIALKYALMQMFTIPTKETKDPDGESHEVVDSKKEDFVNPVERAHYLLESKTYEELLKRYKEVPDELRKDRNVMQALQDLKIKFGK